MTLRPIPQPASLSLATLPPITFGAGTFSGQYNFNPDFDVADLIREAFRLGVRSFDTSPYYGDSEKLLGGGLRKLFASGIKREEVFLMTKCGRYGVWEFDYSFNTVKRSVARSCRRLGVKYLDVVYLHDVEFVGAERVLEAVRALFELKEQGIVRNVGISGYPLQVLNFLANQIQSSIDPLDVVLSYSHYNIQNTTLIPQIAKFKTAGVRHVLSASPLSMGLLKESGPPGWHPASQELKGRVVDAVQYLHENYDSKYTMANVAVGFALRHAPRDQLGSTVIGFCTIPELHEAIAIYWEVMSREPAVVKARDHVEAEVRRVLGPVVNETWASPPEIGRLVDPTTPFADEVDDHAE